MLNKKTGISIPWFTRTTSLNIFIQNQIRELVKNIFLKQNIFISDIFIQEYPKVFNLIFNIYLINKKQYVLILPIMEIIKKILLFLTKKNILITYKIAPNLYSEIDILVNWLNLKLHNEPLKTKKLLKQILKQYDTIIK